MSAFGSHFLPKSRYLSLQDFKIKLWVSTSRERSKTLVTYWFYPCLLLYVFNYPSLNILSKHWQHLTTWEILLGFSDPCDSLMMCLYFGSSEVERCFPRGASGAFLFSSMFCVQSSGWCKPLVVVVLEFKQNGLDFASVIQGNPQTPACAVFWLALIMCDTFHWTWKSSGQAHWCVYTSLSFNRTKFKSHLKAIVSNYIVFTAQQ